MDCPTIPELEAEELSRLLGGTRRPYKAMLEVTQRCNNRCTHCYLDPFGRVPDPDPSFEFLVELMDALAAEGCLFLAFTGGEPLLRGDFAALYEAAKRRGFLISVFTNARLITEELADFLAELPPRLMSVSIYGATADGYEAVSRVPGSFEQAMSGIRRLRRRGIPAHLKTIAMRSNVHELEGMMSLAQELGWQLVYDPGITPTLDGGCHVLAERLSPEEIVALDLRHPRRRQMLELLRERWHGTVIGPRLVSCQAGQLNLYVDVNGVVFPCVSARSTSWPLDRTRLRESLREIFYHEFPRLREQPVAEPYPCGECALHYLCMGCHAWRELEMGTAMLPCPFNCRLGQLRAEALGLDPTLPPGAGAG